MVKLYLIDGNAYIHRAYHAMPPLTTSKGEMVNAVFGFMKMLLKMINTYKPEYIAVCFDYPAKTFRHEKFEAYKANRKEIDAELKTQMPIARKAAQILGLNIIEKQGYEADDIIATLARQAEKDNNEVVVVSGDKDILQLVNSKINVLNESKNILYNSEKVEAKYGLKPAQLIDMFALMGDQSDNVPGVKGIGEKTAVKLINKYQTLENLLDNSDELQGKVKDLVSSSKKDALDSKDLVTLLDKVPLDLKWNDCRIMQVEKGKVIEFIKSMEFNSLLKEVLDNTATPKSSKMSVKTNNLNNLDEFISKLNEFKKLGAYGLDIVYDNLKPVLVSAANKSNVFSYFAENKSDFDQIWKEITPSNEPIFGYDIKKFKTNIPETNIFDVMLASYCLNPSKSNHDLKTISLEFLNKAPTSFDWVEAVEKGKIKLSEIDKKELVSFSGHNAQIIYEAGIRIRALLYEKQLSNLYNNIELPLIKTLAEMEETGIKIDIPYLKKLSDEFEAKSTKLKEDIFRIAGEEFNPNSPKQLGFILFEKLKLPIIRKTKTGYSTDEEVLTILAKQHSLPSKLIDYREVVKLKSTYIDAILKLTDKKTSKIHTSLNQTVTATGRLSSSDPNLQNIPIRSEYGKEIRRAFIPEKGNIFISADYSQIDLRVLAHITKDAILINSFNKGMDIHTITASEVFGVPLDKVRDDLRRSAKAINFGIVYGISPFGLAKQLGIAPDEAKTYINKYFSKYKGIRLWIENIIRDTKAKGFVKTLLGRIRYIPEIYSKNHQIRSFAERVAMNTPIQGTSADIIKISMLNIEKAFAQKNLKTKMLIQVHDDLLFEVPEYEVKIIPGIIKNEMEKAIKLDVPVVVDIKCGNNWADMSKKN